MALLQNKWRDSHSAFVYKRSMLIVQVPENNKTKITYGNVK